MGCRSYASQTVPTHPARKQRYSYVGITPLERRIEIHEKQPSCWGCFCFCGMIGVIGRGGGIRYKNGETDTNLKKRGG